MTVSRSQDVAARYNEVYAPSLAVSGESLDMSLARLLENYGVIDPVRDRASERLPLALREMGYDSLQGKVVLDYACGSAKSAVVFAQAGATVFGFDFASNAISTGRRRAFANGVGDRVHLAVMSADRLGFPSDSFDYIFGYEVLYYLHGLDFGYEALRVLKPGGRAVFCEALDSNATLRWMRRCLRWATGTVNRTGGHALTMDEIRAAFGGATVETYPVNLFAMAKRLFALKNQPSPGWVGFLKALDRWCLKRFPDLRRWCGEVVIVVTK